MIAYTEHDILTDGDWAMLPRGDARDLSFGRINAIHDMTSLNVCEVRVLLGPLSRDTVYLEPDALRRCEFTTALLRGGVRSLFQLMPLVDELTPLELEEAADFLAQLAQRP